MKWIETGLIPWIANRERRGGIRVVGPLRLDVAEDRALAERAIAFRREQNLLRASYLEDAAQRRVEERLQLDRRSWHFVALRGDEIVVTMRVTPAPFEVDALVPELRTHARGDFDGYLEAGRLCTAIHLEHKGRIATQVAVTAMLWSLLYASCRGGVALCKRDKVAFLGKFGLTCIASNVSVPGRGDDYAVIAASRGDLLRALATSAFGNAVGSIGARAMARSER